MRYIIDPFTSLIQDTGSGPHALGELGVLLSSLLDKGASRKDLIKLVMDSFGVTASEAEKLVDQALGLDEEEPEPDNDYEDDPNPF